MAGIETVSSSVKWALEIYPWSSDPSLNQSVSAQTATPSVLVAAPDASFANAITEDIKKTIYSNDNNADKSVPNKARYTSLGITAISINRSKGSPASTASIRVVGRLAKEIKVGTWCVLSTTQEDVNLIKFIGQIDTLNISYASDGKGALRQVTNINLREWSHVLLQAVNYDIGSVFAQIRKNTALGAAGEAQAAENARRQNSIDAAGEARKIAKQAFDPFEGVHVALKLIGLISSVDELDVAKNVETKKFKDLVIRPTEVPTEIIKRVGLSVNNTQLNENKEKSSANSPEGSSTNVWDSGFVRVVSGNKYPPALSNGLWDGFFVEPGNTGVSINQLIQTARDAWNSRRDKIVLPNSLININTAESVWSLINLYAESDLYEIYTDMLHQKRSQSSRNPSSVPAIILRSKPYTLRQILNNTDSYIFKSSSGVTSPANVRANISTDWALYDEMPLIKINSASIVSFALQNEFLSSPNFIKLFIGGNNGLQNGFKEAASSINRGLVVPEQKRFGGQMFTGNITYNAIRPNENGGVSNIVEYGKIATELWRTWYSYRYLMPDATLTIKDDNYPLTIGFNMQFRIGDYNLAGHIEGYNIQSSIDAKGVESTNIVISLSRIVKYELNTYSALPTEAFGNLFGN